MIEAFEAKQAQGKKPRGRPRTKSLGASVPLSNGTQRKSRSRSRHSNHRQVVNSPASENDMLTDDDDDVNGDDDDRDYVQKSMKPSSPRRSQKVARHSDEPRSIDMNEAHAIDSAKLQQILAVRRNKHTTRIC